MPIMPKQKNPSTQFGAMLIELRNKRNMTQTDLAQAIDSTQRAISYYEAQGGNPTIEIIIKLAHALHVTTDELLGAKSQAKHESSTTNKRLWKRFSTLENLPTQDQKAVMRLINSLSESRGVA